MPSARAEEIGADKPPSLRLAACVFLFVGWGCVCVLHGVCMRERVLCARSHVLGRICIGWLCRLGQFCLLSWSCRADVMLGAVETGTTAVPGAMS